MSAAAVDIDDDGDFDVVALSDSLDLVVLKNDGGHFTCQLPRRSAGWQSVPPEPELGHGRVPAQLFIQTASPSVIVPLNRTSLVCVIAIATKPRVGSLNQKVP